MSNSPDELSQQQIFGGGGFSLEQGNAALGNLLLHFTTSTTITAASGKTFIDGQVAQGAILASRSHPQTSRPRVRTRQGQATDPHSIPERLCREKIAKRMRALQGFLPNSNKIDRAAMLDDTLDYMKFLRPQVKILSMSRRGGTGASGAGAMTQLVAETAVKSAEGKEAGDEESKQQQVWEKWANDGTENQVAKLAKLMEEDDIGAAMQFLQSKALCIMPISAATTICSCHHQQKPQPPSKTTEPNAPS